MNKNKSRVFMGGIPNARQTRIKELLKVQTGNFPDTYLRVPLLQGRVTRIHTNNTLLHKIRSRIVHCLERKTLVGFWRGVSQHGLEWKAARYTSLSCTSDVSTVISRDNL
ncbi:hypothetical protein IFM89_001301 [Coptis chinensis]|uniref:Uncharacterized protein n=1 Tax=Coptis chinensis TaxID=261450 RepID=A0A835MGZ4_9MAGN|nr:hypothetical protein IFM89_001301 [Coptis chinensis]